VIINNQCPNIGLKSPVYFIKDAICHGYLHQQVDFKSEMKVSLKIGMIKDTFGGALLYRLQQKVNTLISTQLLVIWEFKINKLYSYAWLIEHENTLVWDKDKLKMLYDVYNNQDDTESIFNAGRWMLDDNTKLKTECKASYEGYFRMNIIISEEKYLLLLQKPLWIDLNR
jgi:hypothetical protein